MPVVINRELQNQIDELNNLHKRIQTLADRHGRSYLRELESLVVLAETMDIDRVYYLPGPAGADRIPVICVLGPVIERRLKT